MTNTTATAKSLLAAAEVEVTSHDQWVAFWNANVSAFAAEIIPAKIVAEAQGGDYMAQELVASDAQAIARLEAMTDDELALREAESQAETGWNACEGKYEPYYYWSAQEDLHRIAALRDFRADQAAQAAWSVAPEGHLTHRPFAALLAA